MAGTTFEIVLTNAAGQPPAPSPQQTLAGAPPVYLPGQGLQAPAPPPFVLPPNALPGSQGVSVLGQQPPFVTGANPGNASLIQSVTPVEIVKSIPLRIAGAGDNSPGPDNAAAGGGAAGGPGLIGSLLEAAGPIGIAASAAAITLRTFTGAVQSAAEATTKLAGNDNYGGLSKAADSAATGLLLINPVAGAVVKAELAVFDSFMHVADAFVKRGKDLEGFSGELAGARATADVNSVLADIREGFELGPALAELTSRQSEFSLELRELLLPIKQWVIEQLADILKGMTEILKDGQVAWNVMKAALSPEGVEFLVNAIWSGAVRNNLGEQLGQYKKYIEQIAQSAKILADKAREEQNLKAAGLLDAQLRLLGNQRMPGNQDLQPFDGGPGPRLGIPAVLAGGL